MEWPQIITAALGVIGGVGTIAAALATWRKSRVEVAAQNLQEAKQQREALSEDFERRTKELELARARIEKLDQENERLREEKREAALKLIDYMLDAAKLHEENARLKSQQSGGSK